LVVHLPCPQQMQRLAHITQRHPFRMCGGLWVRQSVFQSSRCGAAFGQRLGDFQMIQATIADMAADVEAARLLVESAARAYDEGRRCDMEAGMAKYYASEAALENALEAMRIMGAYGYSSEFVVERLYRDAPLLAIGEGTNEMQRIIIARQLVERNRV